MLFLCLSTKYISAQVLSSPAGGYWNVPSTWQGGLVPVAGQDVVIISNSNVIIDNYNTPKVDDVTVNASGKLDITNTSISTLTFGGNLTVNGILNNLGGMDVSSTNKSFILGPGASYTHNPRNNTLLDEAVFTTMQETFDATSYLYVYKWFDLSIGLGSTNRVTSTYIGNLTLAVPTPGSRWNQNGTLMDVLNGVQKVKGTLVIQDGTVVMDDGTGGSTNLILADVIVSGTGNIIFQAGQNRPFTLFTNNFTDVSTSAAASVVMDSCFSLLIWNVNGSAVIGHNFNAIRGSDAEAGGDARITINGSLNINGGNVCFIKRASAPLDLNVIANTTINGSPASVSFSDGNFGNVTFRTNNFTISGGNNNVLLGGNNSIPKPTGIFTMTVNIDFLVNGASTTTLIKSDTSASQKFSLRVGRDFIVSGSTNAAITLANHRGALTSNVIRNMTLTNGKFIGQANANATGIDSVLVGLDFLYNSPTAADYFRINYGQGTTVFRTTGNFSMLNSGLLLGQGFEGIYNGPANIKYTIGGAFTITNSRFCGMYNALSTVTTGSLTMNVTGAYTMNSGVFRGIDNRYKPNSGIITFTASSFTYNGGNFNAFQTVNNTLGIGSISITNNCSITFSGVNDTLMFVGYSVIFPDNNSLTLNLSIGGSMTIGGANGTFISSIGNAPEIINITGDLNYVNGRNSFNSYPNSAMANAHKVNLTVNGNVTVTGGTNFLSAFNDSLTATVNGNLSITNGSLAVQAGNTYGRLNVKGGYNQVGGTFYIHNNTNNTSFNSIEVTINSDSNAVGDFIHTGGVINFDNNNSGPAFTMNVRSPNVTLGGTGSITRAGAGTGTVWGNLTYRYPGTVNFNRSGTHNIQQIRQKIDGTTYFNIVSGYLQVASYVSGPLFDMLSVTVDATLDMHGLQIKSNVQQPWSGISIAGRLKTTHVNGIYNATTNATIDFTGQMYFWLQTNSTVEYNGTDNQIISGVGLGTATLSISKYYNLDVNFQGTPDVEFVYPTNTPDLNGVVIRNRLVLTNGELNLDNDHVGTTGGRSIILTKGTYDMITRTNGYIRSEVSTGIGYGTVRWVVGNNPQPHIVPFGYSSTQYIPFTFEKTSTGSVDTLTVSTYHTIASNVPYPPGVLHVNGYTGGDNSANTVDRFWYMKARGITSANVTFVATPAEVGGIPNLRAQRWMMLPKAWELPYQGSSQSPLATGTLVANDTGLSGNWWTLAGLATPLPVELTSMTGTCEENHAVLKWTTQSEVNNKHFTILRSNDGNSYQQIGTVEGAGTVSSTQEYSFTDPDVLTERITYYKLTQTDFDERTKEYSPIAVSRCNDSRKTEFKAYAANESALQIVIQTDEAANFHFRLFDLQGKVIGEFEKHVAEGFNSFLLNHDELSNGIYLLNAWSEKDAFTQKISIYRTR